MGRSCPCDVEGRQPRQRTETTTEGLAMTAMFGTLGIICAYLIAGWMGYTLGFDAGVRSERTKRGIRRG